MTSPGGLVSRPASSVEESQARYSEYAPSGIEWLGEVPSHWQTRRLRWSGDFRGGGTPSKSTEAYWDGKIPWVSPKDMKNFRVTDTSDHISERGLTESTTSLVPKGSVLLVVRSGILRRTLPVAIAERAVALNQDLKAIVPYEEVEADYLGYWIRAHQGPLLAEWRKEGTTVESLESDLIKNTWITLPPRSEQRAIGRFLDDRTAQIDRLIDKKERLIELLEERHTALITKAVTKGLDPNVPMKDSGVEWLGEIPEHWDVTKLKTTAEIQTGLTIGQNYSGPTEERPYLRVANVQDGYLDLSKITTVDVPQSEIEKTRLQSGDVLMTEGGDFDKLGRGYVWEGQIEGCLHQNHIFAIRPRQDHLSPRFLSYVTTSRYGRTYFSATAKQSTNLASTNRTKVGNFPLPLPPREEQARIVAALEQRESVTEQLKDLIQQAVSYLQEYRSALITAAVTGKIDLRDRAA